MSKKEIKPEDFPFAELLGFKKLTEKQKLGKKFLEIAKQFKTPKK